MKINGFDLGTTINYSINEKDEILFRDSSVLRLLPSRMEAINLLIKTQNWSQLTYLILLIAGSVCFVLKLPIETAFWFVLSLATPLVFRMHLLQTRLHKLEPRISNRKEPWQHKLRAAFLSLSAGHLLFFASVSFISSLPDLLPLLLHPQRSQLATLINASPLIILGVFFVGFYVWRKNLKATTQNKEEQETFKLRLEMIKGLSRPLALSWFLLLVIASIACCLVLLMTARDFSLEQQLYDPTAEYIGTIAQLAEPFLIKTINTILALLFVLFFANHYARRIWILCGKPITPFVEQHAFDASWKGISAGLWFSLALTVFSMLVAGSLFAFRESLPTVFLNQIGTL